MRRVAVSNAAYSALPALRVRIVLYAHRHLARTRNHPSLTPRARASPSCLVFGQAGFIVDDVWLVPRPTVLPAGTGMRGWLSTFTQAFLNAIPEDNPGGREKRKNRTGALSVAV